MHRGGEGWCGFGWQAPRSVVILPAARQAHGNCRDAVGRRRRAGGGPVRWGDGANGCSIGAATGGCCLSHPSSIPMMSLRHHLFVRWIAAALLCLLAGCSALPRIVPDMARSTPAPQLDGARGPLTPQRSREILAALSASGHASDVLGRHLALEQAISPHPLTAGNQVRLLQDGRSTYAAMFAAIASARDHINMESYIVEDDEAGTRFADALIAKQRAGVQVNLIYDAVGSIGTKAEFFTRLGDAGVKVLEFNPVNPLQAKVGWDVNQRDHRKLLIVDGRTAFLGGINVSSVYSGGSAQKFAGSHKASDLPWRDTDPADRRPGRRRLPAALHRHLDAAEGPGTPRAHLLPADRAPGQRGRARDRRLARGALQPDLRDLHLRDRRGRARGAADQRVLRARPAAGRVAEGGRRARRRRQADPARAHRFGAGVQRRPLLLRRAARRRRADLRTQARAAAREDGADRRRLVDRRLDQPRLAQLPCTTRRSTRSCSGPNSAPACAPPSRPIWPNRRRSRWHNGGVARRSIGSRKASRGCGSTGYETAARRRLGCLPRVRTRRVAGARAGRRRPAREGRGLSRRARRQRIPPAAGARIDRGRQRPARRRPTRS